ncbi:MAG: hypothetical protein IJ512_04635, partial [Ruminococcus sp.]|nr:hypothetical protein [Ruminococcus sp.]
TGLEDSVQLKSGNYMAQCMYRTTEDGNWVFGDLIYFSVGTSTVSLQVLPGTDNEATQFNWNSIASAIKYGVRIYEADNWENQVYSNWTYTGLEDSVQLKSGNYMAQCMYRTTEDGDWAFGDLIYFKVTEGYLQADINQSGTTTLLDALLLQKHLLHLKSLTVEQKAAADMNSDGRVNIFDLSLLKEHLQ